LLPSSSYTQVQQDLRRQAELQQRAIQVGQELRKSRCRLLKSQLRQINEQLAIEINLESQLFSWAASKNLFGKLFGLEDRGCCRLDTEVLQSDMEKRRIAEILQKWPALMSR